jgi:3-oxoacyl-[acyl-carrier protein] reductase
MQKIIFITGTSRGIGLYLSEKFRDLGHIVIGCNSQTMDVTNEASVIDYFKWIKREYGQLDILINNAGIASMNHCLLTTGAKASQIMNVNFIGTFLCSREAGKLMINRGGKIINISSVAVPMSLQGEAVYVASKAAIEALTKVMAKEVPGVTVNALRIGVTQTKLSKDAPQWIVKNTFEEIFDAVQKIIKDNKTGQIYETASVRRVKG